MLSAGLTIGLDLGTPADPSALAVLETTWPENGRPTHQVRHLQRFHAGTAYGAVLAGVEAALKAGPASVVLDVTGVGKAIVAPFHATVEVTLTNGEEASEGTRLRVSRLDVAASVQMTLQQERLRIARLPLAEELARELRAFRPRQLAAEAGAAAWRERPGDDLVLAVAVALWHAERCRPIRPEDVLIGESALGEPPTLQWWPN